MTMPEAGGPHPLDLFERHIRDIHIQDDIFPQGVTAQALDNLQGEMGRRLKMMPLL